MEHAPDARVDDDVELPVDGPTEDQGVDEALAVLDGIEDRPLKDHVPAFESVHAALQDRLAENQR